jgi:hypothetical protein
MQLSDKEYETARIRIAHELERHPQLHDTGWGDKHQWYSSRKEEMEAGRQRILDDHRRIAEMATFLHPVDFTFTARNSAALYVPSIQQFFGTVRTGHFIAACLLAGFNIRPVLPKDKHVHEVRVNIDLTDFRRHIDEARTSGKPLSLHSAKFDRLVNNWLVRDRKKRVWAR